MAEDDRESGGLHVAEHNQRNEDKARQHGGGEQDAVLPRLQKRQRRRSEMETETGSGEGGRTHPLHDGHDAVAEQVHDVEDEEAADARENFVWTKMKTDASPDMKHLTYTRPLVVGCSICSINQLLVNTYSYMN